MKALKKHKLFVMFLSLIAALCFTTLAFGYEAAFADRVEQTKGKVTVYQLQPESKSLMQSFVIKTANGKLIVIDGGRDGVGEDYAPYLPSALRAIAGVGEGEYFEVEAWFLSHEHNDHFAELSKMLYAYDSAETVTLEVGFDGNDAKVTFATDKNYKINNFYFDFPTGAYRSGDVSDDWLSLLKTGLDKYAAANGIAVSGETYFDDLNGAVINAAAIKNGLNITIDGVRFEILQTWALGDGQANNNSTVMRMWVDGQSMMFLNDAAVSAGDRLLNTYGAAYLKSDIVQLAHHGQNGVAKDVYDAIDAKVRFWACPDWVWQDTSTDSYQTDTVRTWFNLPRDYVRAEDKLDKATDKVAGIYSKYPAENSDHTYAVSAWTDEILEEMSIKMPYAKAYVDQTNFVMMDGAGIRLNEDSTGLRFSAKMASYDPDASYGMVIVPRSYIEDNSITGGYVERLTEIYGADNIINLTSSVVDGTKVGAGACYVIYGSIANIKYKNMNVEFTAIAYELKDGVYTYAKFNSLDDISRTVMNVATKAANADVADDSTFDDEERAIIDGFVHKAVSQKNGVAESEYDPSAEIDYAMSFGKETLDVEWGESSTVEFTSVFDSECIEFNYDKAYVSYDASTGVIKAIKKGTSKISASCFGKTATLDVNCTIKEGYYATFDNEAYADIVTLNSREYRDAKSISTSYVESYTDSNGVTENGVVKFDVTASWNGIADWVINLSDDIPVTGGVTIRFLVASTDATNMYFRYTANSSTNMDVSYATGSSPRFCTDADTRNSVLGKWQTLYISYSNCTGDFNLVEMLVTGASAGSVSTFYVSRVMEGNRIDELKKEDIKGIVEALKSGLKENELANFDDANYAKLIKSTYDDDTLTVTYLEEYAGETGVVKLVYETADANLGIVVPLIKPLDEGATATYTVRVRFEQSYDDSNNALPNPTAVIWKRSDSYGQTVTGDEWSMPCSTYDVWHTKAVTTSGLEKDSLMIAGYVPDAKKITMYISVIMSGDKVNYLKEQAVANKKQALKKALTGDQLANYDSADYFDFVYAVGNTNMGPVKAEWLAQYEGETGVMKITLTNDNAGSADVGVVLELMKDFTATGLTVKYRVENETDSTGTAFSVGRWRYVNSLNVFDGDITAQNFTVGEWTEQYVSYSPQDGKKTDAIAWYSFGDAYASYVLYVSCITAGNTTAAD